MPRTPTGVKVGGTPRSNSGVTVAPTQKNLAQRDTGSILSGRDDTSDPQDIKVAGGDWSSVTTDGDSRNRDPQDVIPRVTKEATVRPPESWESIGYGS